ncbi:MAG: hypothetical protein KA250_13185, partial [Verrucomicrobiales bacterium]|nr:hypothetical protein [Verrucomicrobiales bacterium]
FGSEMKKRKRVPAFFLLFGIAFALIWFVLWLPKSKIALDSARSNPVWAWNHGSPEMQRVAAQKLAGMIEPGSDLKEVIDLIGPGSLGWPERFDRDYSGESAIGFNVRSWYNNGLDIHYRDGRVVGVSYYD